LTKQHVPSAGLRPATTTTTIRSVHAERASVGTAGHGQSATARAQRRQQRAQRGAGPGLSKVADGKKNPCTSTTARGYQAGTFSFEGITQTSWGGGKREIVDVKRRSAHERPKIIAALRPVRRRADDARRLEPATRTVALPPIAVALPAVLRVWRSCGREAGRPFTPPRARGWATSPSMTCEMRCEHRPSAVRGS
jgi:hypothetical protein